MDVERIIYEIEQLQEMFEAPDTSPFSANDISAGITAHRVSMLRVRSRDESF